MYHIYFYKLRQNDKNYDISTYINIIKKFSCFILRVKIFKKCSDTSCTTGAGVASSNKAPFCGTATSATNTGNVVNIGSCGKCQKTSGGGGGAVTCSAGAFVTGSSQCVQGSCGTNKVCCSDGSCVAKGTPDGQNCL